ncbi:hypothetical protein [Bradyrhizobium sp. 2TAF24]|uniref:hypothetical protein n=1 Tax=Bradyrhizobium sp. 2TAF24 TaxID=3233011 RepID=UPI003F912F98
MGTLFSFSPFIAFALQMRAISAEVTLFSGAAIALVLVLHELSSGRSVKVLEAGAVVLLGALGLYVTLMPSAYSIRGVRLAVDAGLLAIVLTSIAIRLPFTLQYAREQVSPEIAALPSFVAVNTIIAWAWAAAFAVMVLTDLVMLYRPQVSLWIGIALSIAAFAGAVWFTRWYPARVRARAIAARIKVGA